MRRRHNMLLMFALLGAAVGMPAVTHGETPSERLAHYNVVWDSPSEDSKGSMPFGNGDIGVNAWVEPNGDLLLLLSKTDAWSENHRLLKLGRVRIRLGTGLLADDAAFEQELRLNEGEMTVRFGPDGEKARMRVWVDAHHPVVRIEAESAEPSALETTLEAWRTEERELTGDEAHSAYGIHGGPDPIIVYPDIVLEDREESIAWYHRNEKSIWAGNLRHQGLEALIEQQDDPLKHHTFGGLIEGEGLRNDGDKTLASVEPRERFVVNIHVRSEQTPSAEAWVSDLEEQAKEVNQQVSFEEARAAHRDWWRQFWNRSWIFVEGPPEAETITRGYVLQRYINACGGRGVHPIKFNGSIFTVDMDGYDPDYRRWGGPYWWQNTRLPYWPMLASGDFDMMRPLFRMYKATLPLAEFRTQQWFGHGGAFFPETMYFWGMFTNTNYGWDAQREELGLETGELVNPYIRREYTASPELMAMMFDYYEYTGDEAFLREHLLPMSDVLLEFWDKHYERNEEGHLVMYPAQALETLQDAKNPTPDIAGLKWVLDKLLDMPEEAAGAERRTFWTQLRESIPPLPMAGEEGQKRVLGAEEVYGGRGNMENPELYTVFPFRFYGVEKPELDVGRRTFEHRVHQANFGWHQDDTQAAFLGLTETAASKVAERAANTHEGSRFPAFWGPNHDWIPDQDHGGNLMKTLQTMLLQAEDDEIWLFPAWPKDWDVEFKLHAPRQTILKGAYREGKLERLDVNPESRRNDVKVMLEMETNLE